MEYKGSPEFEKFWSYLQDESDRCVAIVVAAYFDEKLGEMLGNDSGSFFAKIRDARAGGLLTPDEHDDLITVKELRNEFAHELAAKGFDASKTARVEALKTWRRISGALPQYLRLYPTARERLLYVAGAFFVRLSKRPTTTVGVLSVPELHDTDAFPFTSSR